MTGDRNAIPTLPARLVELRVASGMSQDELAAKAGTSKFSLSKLERGERFPSLDLAGRIADALGVLVDDLRMPVGSKRRKIIPKKLADQG